MYYEVYSITTRIKTRGAFYLHVVCIIKYIPLQQGLRQVQLL